MHQLLKKNLCRTPLVQHLNMYEIHSDPLDLILEVKRFQAVSHNWLSGVSMLMSNNTTLANNEKVVAILMEDVADLGSCQPDIIKNLSRINHTLYGKVLTAYLIFHSGRFGSSMYYDYLNDLTTIIEVMDGLSRHTEHQSLFSNLEQFIICNHDVIMRSIGAEKFVETFYKILRWYGASPIQDLFITYSSRVMALFGYDMLVKFDIFLHTPFRESVANMALSEQDMFREKIGVEEFNYIRYICLLGGGKDNG